MKTFNKNFNLVIIGQIISLFGATILKFALSLYVLDVTGRADVFAAILAISTIPVIVFSPIGGAIADRFNRRNLMVIFDFLSSALVFIFAICILNGEPSILLIGVVMTLLSIISTMYQPTVQSSIPVLVDQDNLIKANGVVSGVGALTNIVAPILGGILYSFVSLRYIVIISGISFFLSAVMEIFIQIPFKKQQQSGHIVITIFKDMKKGLQYITKNPFIIKFMFLAAGLNMFVVPLYLVGFPYIIKITMEADSTLFGVAQGLTSFATILAAATIGVISKKLSINKLYLWLISMSVIIFLMGLSVHPMVLNIGFWLPFISFTLSAMALLFVSTIVSIFVITMIQKETPNELLGKVMAILFAGSACAMPIGQIIYGALIDNFKMSVYIPVFVACAFTLAIAVVAKMILKENIKMTIKEVDKK